MWFILILLSLIVSIRSPGLLDLLATRTELLHSFCNSHAPTSEFQNYYSALVCGQKLSNIESYGLRGLGLYHLMVVSGAHLVIVELWLSKFIKQGTRIRPWLITILLGLYVAMTHWGAPVVRAWVNWNFSQFNNEFKMGLKPHEVTLFTGAFCLTLFPEFAGMLSFQLSWLAGLSLNIVRRDTFKSHALVYILIFPALSSLGNPHPISIFINFLVAPLLGLFLLPLTALSFIFPIHSFVDFLWRGLIQFSLNFTQYFPNTQNNYVTLSGPHIWIYIFGIHLILALHRRWRNHIHV